MQIVRGLHMGDMTVGGRAYLLVDGGTCVLIDTGGPDGTLGVGQLIEKAGREPGDVGLILLTHAHPGHAGNAEALRGLCGAPLAATAAVAGVLADPPVPRRRLLRSLLGSPAAMAPAHVDRVVAPGERIDIAGGIDVLDAPGHAPGSVAFHLRLVDALVVGDAAAVDAGGLRPPPARTCADPALAAATARRLADLAAHCLAPGHGLPMVDGRLPTRSRR